jgi:hypothetical protein
VPPDAVEEEPKPARVERREGGITGAPDERQRSIEERAVAGLDPPPQDAARVQVLGQFGHGEREVGYLGRIQPHGRGIDFRQDLG